MRSCAKAFYLRVRRVFLWAFGLACARKRRFDTALCRRILIIRADRVGDMALSTPVFSAVKKSVPGASLTVLASPSNAPILLNNPNVDEILVFDAKASLKEKWRVLKTLRARRFDLAIDLHDDYPLETAVIARLSGAPHRAGFAGYGREIFFTQPVPKVSEHVHFIETNRRLLDNLAVSAEPGESAIFMTDKEKEWADGWIRGHDLARKTLIGMHPGAYYPTQRWPAAYYAKLIQSIREQTDADVILFGGPSDADVVAAIQNAVEGVRHFPFTGDDPRQWLALLARCRLLVCNNSGPLHCAVALDVPTISFMGPTVKEKWAPPAGARHRVLRRDNLPCIGCNRGTCPLGTDACMQSILPGEVITLIRSTPLLQ